jgi:hypothetical protein
VGFEPTTFRLRVAAWPSRRCHRVPSSQLRSAGPSVQCAPDQRCCGWGNDQGNDQLQQEGTILHHEFHERAEPSDGPPWLEELVSPGLHLKIDGASRAAVVG